MKGNILLVDDNLKTIKYFKKCLEKEYFVFYYENGVEAIKSIENGLDYDLALFDLNFENQRISCQELIDISKRKNPDIPIMTLSAWGYTSMDVSRNLSKLHPANELVEIINDFLK